MDFYASWENRYGNWALKDIFLPPNYFETNFPSFFIRSNHWIFFFILISDVAKFFIVLHSLFEKVISKFFLKSRAIKDVMVIGN